MARTLTTEDVELMEGMMVRAVAKGLSDVGLGYDDETEKKAIRSDLGWVRQQREAGESRTQQVRKGFLSLAILAAGVAILYCLEHLGALVEMITKLFSSGVSQ